MKVSGVQMLSERESEMVAAIKKSIKEERLNISSKREVVFNDEDEEKIAQDTAVRILGQMKEFCSSVKEDKGGVELSEKAIKKISDIFHGTGNNKEEMNTKKKNDGEEDKKHDQEQSKTSGTVNNKEEMNTKKKNDGEEEKKQDQEQSKTSKKKNDNKKKDGERNKKHDQEKSKTSKKKNEENDDKKERKKITLHEYHHYHHHHYSSTRQPSIFGEPSIFGQPSIFDAISDENHVNWCTIL